MACDFKMTFDLWTKLTPDVGHNIVIEHVKKNGGALSTFEKNRNRSTATHC